MFSKINLLNIVSTHFKTFRNPQKEGVRILELIVYLTIPLVLAGIVVFWVRYTFSDELLNVLITALSILIGLLLNLLVLLFDIAGKVDTTDPMRNVKKELLKETYSNVSFGILASIMGVFLLVICFKDSLKIPANFLAMYFIGLFGYTLLMVLKRTHSLLSKQFDSN